MQTKRRRHLKTVWILVLAVLVCALAVWLGWRWYDNNVDRSGWVEEEGIYYYQDFHADLVTGWLEIDGSRYYFGEDFAMVTYWQKIDEETYYFGADGRMDTGWLEIDGNRHFFRSDGTMVTGWQTLGDGQFYFSDEGIPHTGWLDMDGTRFYFQENGEMLYGWLTLPEGTYYLNEQGAMVTGYITLEEAQYSFQEDGTLFTGWEDMEDGRRYYLTDGPMATGWQEIDGNRYYFGDDGCMVTGWLEQGEYRYFLQEDGSAAVGPKVIDGQTYYFTPKGIHVVLVNYANPVPDYYDVTLATLTGWHQVSEICLEPLQQMLADCVAAGNKYTFNSGYRTIKEQTEILELRTQEHMEDFDLTFEEARKKALETVAVPGTSEHHLGLAVDILGQYAIDWLTEHCWEYGFIVRYTEEKKDITHIISEPWHFRYVGTEVSMDMKDSGLCLEEYLGAA